LDCGESLPGLRAVGTASKDLTVIFLFRARKKPSEIIASLEAIRLETMRSKLKKMSVLCRFWTSEEFALQHCYEGRTEVNLRTVLSGLSLFIWLL
jgi:hypothetical protein